MSPQPGDVVIRTERLLLRDWRESDSEPFARMNADPEVMRHFPAPLERSASDGLIERARAGIAAHGYGLWAVEVIDGPHFIGFIGLIDVEASMPFAPAVEIGWRLARESWGRGYAQEGARATLVFAFEQLELPELVSMTAVTNLNSARVMQRIGMSRDPSDDFEHPALAAGHPLRPHVLYRLARADWLASR